VRGKASPSKLGDAELDKGLTGSLKIKCISIVPNTICSVGKIYFLNYSGQTL